jgi:hypothetical protein
MLKPRQHRIATLLKKFRSWRRRARSQPMVAIILLATYGFTAALGPHWHQHTHWEGCQDADESSDSACASSSIGAACSCHHQTLEQRLIPKNSLPILMRNAAAAEAGTMCAVCAYYGQSVLSRVLPLRTQSANCCTLIGAAQASADSHSLLRANSRAPPAVRAFV